MVIFFQQLPTNTLKYTLKTCADWRYNVNRLWRGLSRGYEVRTRAPCRRIPGSYWFVVNRMPAPAWRWWRRSFSQIARHWNMWDSDIFKRKKMLCFLCAGVCRWWPGGAVLFQTVPVSVYKAGTTDAPSPATGGATGGGFCSGSGCHWQRGRLASLSLVYQIFRYVSQRNIRRMLLRVVELRFFGVCHSRQMRTERRWETQKERDHWEHRGVDGRIIIQWIYM